MLTMKINGVNIMPFVRQRGVKFSRTWVNGPNAGTLMNGDEVLDRRAVKYRWQIACMPLTAAQLSEMMTLIDPQTVSVEYTDPKTMTDKTDPYSCKDASIDIVRLERDGVEYWDGLVFTLSQN